jgi:hypothetical protein
LGFQSRENSGSLLDDFSLKPLAFLGHGVDLPVQIPKLHFAGDSEIAEFLLKFCARKVRLVAGSLHRVGQSSDFRLGGAFSRNGVGKLFQSLAEPVEMFDQGIGAGRTSQPIARSGYSGSSV